MRAGRFHAARHHPESAGLGATLRHASGWSAISITGSPQTIELVLVNRMPHPVHSERAHLKLLFRPGILAALDAIALAPQSEAAWSLSLAEPDLHGNQGLQLAVAQPFTLAPGQAVAIRIDGISAAAAGGSRATRVQLHYRGWRLEGGAEVAGTRLLNLPVLRRHAPASLPATEWRSGSTASSGPFLAGFVDGADVLNDGESLNTLRVRIVNTSAQALQLSDDGDAATRLFLSFRTGSAEAGWGLLGVPSDHLGLTLPMRAGSALQAGWQIDNHTLRCVAPLVWEPRQVLELDLTIYSTALAGEAQLVLTYENLPAQDDGDLVLLVRLGRMALRANGLEIRQPVRIGAGLSVQGDVRAAGVLRSQAKHLELTPETFTLGGSVDRYYPVAFADGAWDQGELRLEVFRADSHADLQAGAPRRGSMMASLRCHAAAGGHGSNYGSIEVRQWGGAVAERVFVGGSASDPDQPAHVLWLAGGTRYDWLSNHAANIAAPADLAQPGPIMLGANAYAVKTQPDSGFAAAYVSISESAGRDTGAVPRGAILMWSGRQDAIPLGWLLCDGSRGTPDLRGRFIVGSGAGKYSHGETFDFPAAPVVPDHPPVDGQTGGRLKVALSEVQMPRHVHTGQTSMDGAHYHHVPIWDDASKSNNKTEYPPGNGYLFKQAKEAYNKVPDRGPTTSRAPSEHAHKFTTAVTGSGQGHENLPPFYALCFIMKG